MNIKTITTAAVLLLAAVGCKENDIAFYNEAPRLEYVTAASCTFDDQDYLNAYIADEKTPEKECKVTAQLIGRLLTEPLTFCMQGSPSKTTPYEVKARFENPYTFPTSAAQYEATIYVTCPTKDQSSTQQTSKSGVMEISSEMSNPAHQFGPGRNENLICSLNVTLQLYPGSWDTTWWGIYSTSKYVFMMETFKTTIEGIEKSQASQIRLKQAYAEYSKTNGPLYGDDEMSNEEIDFPLQ